MAPAKERFFDRLENKVFFIILLTTLASTVAVFYVTRSNFYAAMVDDVRERTVIVNKYVQGVVDPDSFAQLNRKEDSVKPVYARQQGMLDRIRQVANVRYLFTAKRSAQGEIIYVTDGLELGSEDFRFVGDLVEQDILPTVNRCLNGTLVESGDIMNTEWGAIFLTCWPVRNAENVVVGAMVMEFDADRLFKRNKEITLYSVIISICIGAVCMLLARFMLRRVSEPFYKRLAYIDYMTGLNNRMAFELDLQRLDQDFNSMQQVSIIMYDLNNLKRINDQQGHEAGDRYIRRMADLVMGFFRDTGRSYRLGGDEFATVVVGADTRSLEEELDKHFSATYCVDDDKEYFAFSYGVATFDPDCDTCLRDVLNRADRHMYIFKAHSKREGNRDESSPEIAV